MVTMIKSTWLLLKATILMHRTMVWPNDFEATFATLFILNYWLREFPLFVTANCFELRWQSKSADAIVLQDLFLLHNTGISNIQNCIPWKMGASPSLLIATIVCKEEETIISSEPLINIKVTLLSALVSGKLPLCKITLPKNI